jgi:hypothetical protein
MFVAGCFLSVKLADDRRVPTWVFESFGVLLLVLLILTMFFWRSKDIGHCAAASRPKSILTFNQFLNNAVIVVRREKALNPQRERNPARELVRSTR